MKLKFGTFLFTHAEDKMRDHQAIQETIEDAIESEELGMDAVWLAEHHFDGSLAYVDPLSFAAALAMSTKRITIGTAVIQAALHHPIRVAEQISLIDHLSEGRFIVGIGKGTKYKLYEFSGYGVDPDEASAREDELEEVLLKCWSGEPFTHRGKYWSFDIPSLRPRSFTQPHPPLMRAVASTQSVIAHAKTGRPFMMSGPTETVKTLVTLAKTTMSETGYDASKITETLEQSWIWKNVVIADTDAEAEQIVATSRNNSVEYFEQLGLESTLPARLRAELEHAPNSFWVYGSPDTVLSRLTELSEIGVGGLIMRLRHGIMPHATARKSLRLFVEHVAPALRASREPSSVA